AGPVHGRAAHGLHNPGGERGEVLGNLPGPRRGARGLPGELNKTVPLVIDEVLVLDARAGLEDHDLDALLHQLIVERSAAGPRAGDPHRARVILIEFSDVNPSLSDLWEPVDVGEAALDVAAVLGGGALVAEFRPNLLLVVERDDEVAADRLEEFGLLDAL